MKFHYELMINRRTAGDPYLVSYGHTKDISLSVSRNAAVISKSFVKNYFSNLENSYLMNLIQERIKRASLFCVFQV